ncbi:aminotransferase class I/II-fold pyridoxal phosphate-dependent enzyme [Cytobacillus horneckiae]|uniref:aminotransferase class I/II-fold pyridoxal phosphate-dependent enzyme n=1 Tax=Cytobacillus horneckiae TaxID=549687 RepID=UPI003D9A8B23
MNQKQMPLVEQLINYINKKPVSFHVPGHKSGRLLSGREEVDQYFQSFLPLDLTELSGLDDLHSPEGAIEEAETLLAEFHRVKKSFFLVNGSTVGNLAMIYAALSKDDTVLVQRNCHKSIMNGISLVGAHPVFITPEYDYEWRVAGGVTLELVEEAISQYPDTKALILTYPNYYGMVYPLEEIIKLCHKHGIVVLVDEAHGAHFAAGDMFPDSALQFNADIVVQSAHKTLPAMTMGAYLHINSELIPAEKIQLYLNMLQSSSPSYPIMASLDIARYYLANYTNQDQINLNKQIKRFKDQLDLIEGIHVLKYNQSIGDPLKVTIHASSLSGFELQKLLEDKGIYTELADPANVLFILPLLKAKTEYPFEKAIHALKAIMETIPIAKKAKSQAVHQFPRISKLITIEGNPPLRQVTLDEAVGNVCGQVVLPYPPGIPLLYPGEIITKEHIDVLKNLLNTGARFQNTRNLHKRYIEIYELSGG